MSFLKFSILWLSTHFQKQSQQWKIEARKHVKYIWKTCKRFMISIIDEIANRRVEKRFLQYWIDDFFKMKFRNVESEFEQILDNRKQYVVTYNHYYIENLQKIHQQKRAKSSQNALKKILELNANEQIDIIQNIVISSQVFLNSFSSNIEVDMNRFACIEIFDCVLTYYKIRTWIWS